jgi:transcriptional repressor NrdR
MNCPFCGNAASDNQTVVETRESAPGVHRRRRCPGCDEAFTTYEQIQRATVMVVKKDGRREEFQREKLLASLRIAARKRPVPEGSLEAIVEDIELRMMGTARGEIASRVIGEMGITRLKALDPIAYIRYASIYHQFVSLEQMLEELQRIALDPSLPGPEQARLFDTSDGEDEGSEAESVAPVRLEDHRAAAPAAL